MDQKLLKNCVKKILLGFYGDSEFSKSPSGDLWLWGKSHKASFRTVSDKFEVQIDNKSFCGGNINSITEEEIYSEIKRVIYNRPLGFLEKYLPEGLNPQELFETGKAKQLNLRFNGKKLDITIK